MGEAQVERGNDEEIEQGRGHQATDNDNGQWVLDLMTWSVAQDHQRHDGKRGGERRHQDR